MPCEKSHADNWNECAASFSSTQLFHRRIVSFGHAAVVRLPQNLLTSSLLNRANCDPLMLSWTDALAAEKQADYFKAVMAFVEGERQRGVTVYPPRERVFHAFKATPLEQVKVVILGQDPYHGPNQANGLCFSVHPGIPFPPSLLNIFKELRSDLNVPMPSHGDLTTWAEQGVLLLNTVLSVAAGTPQSHQGKGWERFTDQVIGVVNRECAHVVFMLWGKPAQSKLPMIDRSKHTVLTSVHPSPLSAHRGFFGCKHFSSANEALLRHGQTPIQWALPATI